MGSLELWGGIEATVNRVGDRFLDQLARSGHDRRTDDLDRFAELGFKRLRYPILWERVWPDFDGPADWKWARDRLDRLRALDVKPIVGLTHHGSGPAWTNLSSPDFADGLARYARAVAERFPWVDAYTPVNEPLTTARFSGLYGHWYPHHRSDLSFATALLNECRAVVRAMRAIREINPTAQLIQTEDLGRVYSTPAVSYQADFENSRRWLSYDFLFGRVDRGHPQWDYLKWVGVPERALRWFLENPLPPDVVGINYYVTSDRFLDDRIENYPPPLRGGNGRHVYADVEAVRVRARGITGVAALLREAWDRYGAALAITEAHLGCSREEQLRWFWEVWQAAQQAQGEGIDVRGVTAWSLLGAFDWDSLVTRDAGHYEPGVFDLRSETGPRATALAGLLTEVGAGDKPSHPVLDGVGWWHRSDRLAYPPDGDVPQTPMRPPESPDERPVMIAGGAGKLATALERICRRRGLACRLLDRRELDIADEASVSRAIEEFSPWAVVNAAGFTRIDAAEDEPGRCHRENVRGPELLARNCAERGIALLTFSSEFVFDGRRHEPYPESHPVAPVNVYGDSKAVSERRVLSLMPNALIVRTGALYGPWDSTNFVSRSLDQIARGECVRAADDMYISPTYLPDLVHASLDLLIDGESGVWHLANRGASSWADFISAAVERSGLDPAGVERRPLAALNFRAPRPTFAALGSERGFFLSASDDALERYLKERSRGVPAVV